MRSPNALVSRDSNSAIHSYLEELRKIAVNSSSLNRTTSARLKEARVLVGTRRVRRRKSDKTTNHLEDDGGNQELALLAPIQIAIADDTIALQQFDEDIFCAPEEKVLESEYGSTCPPYSTPIL